MAMYTLKGIGEISTDAFDEKITLRNLLQHFSFYDFIIVDTKQNILFQYNSNDDWFHNLISLKKFYNQEVITVYKKENKVIGNMGFNNMKIGSQTGELGICINPKYWGNKFSQELLAIMLPHCFTDLNLKEVTTVVYEDNKFSLKPLQVYNFKYSKSYNVKVKNKIIKCNVYSLSRKDYFNNR